MAESHSDMSPSDTQMLDWLDTLPCGISILGDRDHPQSMGMTPKAPGFSHTRDLIQQAMKSRNVQPTQSEDTHDTHPIIGQCCNYHSRAAYGDCVECGRKSRWSKPDSEEVSRLRRQLQEQIDDKHRILREYLAWQVRVSEESVNSVRDVEKALRDMAVAKGGSTAAECESLADILNECIAKLGTA